MKHAMKKDVDKITEFRSIDQDLVVYDYRVPVSTMKSPQKSLINV